MKKIISVIALFVLATLLVGCGQTQSDVQTNAVEQTTVVLTSVATVNKEATRQLEVTRDSENDVFLKRGSDAIVEFYNDEDESQRLVIFDTNIDVVLAPNEHIEVKINAGSQTLEYVFGDEYKQNIIV